MNVIAQQAEPGQSTPSKRPGCGDLLFRLSVYEAGHALVAWALGHPIVSVRMLPRPAETLTEKTFVANNWGSFRDVLEYRAMELFGGQIAEEMTCGATSCCAGDIPRIDEITRILAGLYGEEDHEEIFFRLEDQAEAIFADEHYQAAIEPVAALLYERESAGQMEIPGADIEAVIRLYVPRDETPKGHGERFMNFLRGR